MNECYLFASDEIQGIINGSINACDCSWCCCREDHVEARVLYCELGSRARAHVVVASDIGGLRRQVYTGGSPRCWVGYKGWWRRPMHQQAIVTFRIFVPG